MCTEEAGVREALIRFQAGYSDRDTANLEAFMQLFVDSEQIEMIGVGACRRGGPEWFQGIECIREIVESDWKYWGEVRLNVDGAKITVNGDTAWVTTDGELLNASTFEDALPFYVGMMKELLEEEAHTLQMRVMDATFFGMSRLRDMQRGRGYANPFTFSAVLVQDNGGWRFHTIHWAFPGE